MRSGGGAGLAQHGIGQTRFYPGALRAAGLQRLHQQTFEPAIERHDGKFIGRREYLLHNCPAKRDAHSCRQLIGLLSLVGVLRDGFDDGRFYHHIPALIPAQDGSEIESQAINVHVSDPEAKTSQN